MLKRDCRHFPGDRPCDFHKQDLVTCETCNRYATRGATILIIKLEALGDVLRTTAILPSLRRRYAPCHITWITSGAARELFLGNRLVDQVVSASQGCLPMLLSRSFDVVINPDASARSCELAAISRGRSRFGYTLDPQGVVAPLNGAAAHWLEMGGSDTSKRQNTRTYQSILHEICELDPEGQHIVLDLTADEAEGREDLARDIGIDLERPVVGVNTGAGPRWALKKWKTESFVELIDLILAGTDAQVVLLGGDLEAGRNAFIRSKFDRRVRSPVSRSIRQLVCTVDLCDTVVTGDTLALHLALGLGKQVVALFGPTSAAEIDMYGLGTKVVPDIDCVCCYRPECDRRPSCMDIISADYVYGHLSRHLATAASGQGAGKAVSREEEECMVGEPIADW